MATPSIPLGFHIFSATFTCAGSTHNNVITCGGRNGTYLTALSLNLAWRAALNGSGGPFLPAKLGGNYAIVETKVLMNLGGILYTDISTLVQQGTGTLNTPPLNTAILVRKDTGLSGRPYQARLFCPPLTDEATVDSAGNIGSTPLAGLQSSWNSAMTNLTTAGVVPVIIHDPVTGLIPTAITAFTVKSRLGTIGRRFRR